MKRIKNSLKITAILCVFFFLLSCDNTLGVNDKSGVFLIVTRIVGTDALGDDADYLASDVETGGLGGYLTDPIMITLEAKLKRPEPIIPGASYKTSVIIDRYTITYTSPEGDPVPAAFEGRLAVVCEIDASVDIKIVAVRAEAKTVVPLSLLEDTLNVYWTVAEIRVIGHDLEGNAVEATGFISIYFADWADN
ncbi:hypothetical protein LCGC14_0542740 [marine sediment metagenome]|uniref:Uncharacterized protein n=1 Tax=marine sediment metagenome TaxID=412755 RepID=A0A0F9RSF6_9ZZZZ|nr:hypothetical protein [Candidatus Aminicenantes bacterium]HEB36636.1 hypothetical protein [Candidatus Aminicenantes bacterium]